MTVVATGKGEGMDVEVAGAGNGSPQSVSVSASVDGRSAIRDRNRDAVLDAVLDLFSEDNLSPGPDEVALRAGLSVRSVYRYFEDHDALSRAAIDRQLERLAPLLLIAAIGEGPLDGRITRFVEARIRLQAELGPPSGPPASGPRSIPWKRASSVGPDPAAPPVERHFAPAVGHGCGTRRFPTGRGRHPVLLRVTRPLPRPPGTRPRPGRGHAGRRAPRSPPVLTRVRPAPTATTRPPGPV